MEQAASPDHLLLAAYQFSLPGSLIAKVPADKRDHSRLLVVERTTGNLSEIPFSELPNLLGDNTPLVFNDTKVIPARLIGKRETGGKAEVFLLKPYGENRWEALVKPGKKLLVGSTITFSETFKCTVLDFLPDGKRLVEFHFEGDFEKLLEAYGQIPLPPYIQREVTGEDLERYQTVYAKNRGAVAAPTAGLHFTPELLEHFDKTFLTLHVGLGTFRPVQVERIDAHIMHKEAYTITESAAQKLNARKHLAVGTTSLRALESAATEGGIILPGTHETDIFIYPGYRFRYVDALLTNFHLPGSTLLMLVSAFAGYELTMEAYKKAVQDKFRFFSYGDAMLIL